MNQLDMPSLSEEHVDAAVKSIPEDDHNYNDVKLKTSDQEALASGSINVKNDSDDSVVYLEEMDQANGLSMGEIEIVEDSSQLHYLLVQCQNQDNKEGGDVDQNKDTEEPAKKTIILDANEAKTPVTVKPTLRFIKVTPEASAKPSPPKPPTKKWDGALTKSLIDVRKQMDHLFKKKKGEKAAITALWGQVARILKEKHPKSQTAPYLTWFDCADKWKSLIVTFRSNLLRSRTNPNGTKWEHFESMMELMRNDTSPEFSNLLKTIDFNKKPSNPSPIKFNSSITLTKASNNTPIQPRLSSSPLINAMAVEDAENPKTADYHFAMLIIKELEKLNPDAKKKKKQRILLALYE